MVDIQLDALAVDTRRAIYTMLLERPRSVSEIAAELPVSRPAVSQHLKVLVGADLARARSEGNRRVYSADPIGMMALRDWVDRMWDKAMAGFADFAQTEARREMEREMGQMEKARIAPLVKRVTVPGTPEMVFELFTARTDEWWPRATHSVARGDARSVHMGSGVGERVYEIGSDGAEHEWGRITRWEPAARLALTWHPGLATEQATHVEVTFRQTADGTEVTLVHHGWEARGDEWRAMRDSYDEGWDFVLGQVPGSRLAS